jgi:hypothetical protein
MQCCSCYHAGCATLPAASATSFCPQTKAPWPPARHICSQCTTQVRSKALTPHVAALPSCWLTSCCRPYASYACMSKYTVTGTLLLHLRRGGTYGSTKGSLPDPNASLSQAPHRSFTSPMPPTRLGSQMGSQPSPGGIHVPQPPSMMSPMGAGSFQVHAMSMPAVTGPRAGGCLMQVGPVPVGQTCRPAGRLQEERCQTGP